MQKFGAATRKGFTLIELLMVIAIIGILATAVFASLSSTRAKGRDANRISQLQQMYRAVTLADADPPATLWTTVGGTTAACTAANCDITTALGIGKNGTSVATNFTKYVDPNQPSGACTSLSTTPCKYSVSYINNTGGAASGNPDTQHWEICTLLETGNIAYGGTNSTNGLVHIGSDISSVKAGCY